jgi:hypothetical protein
MSRIGILGLPMLAGRIQNRSVAAGTIVPIGLRGNAQTKRAASIACRVQNVLGTGRWSSVSLWPCRDHSVLIALVAAVVPKTMESIGL